MNFGYQPPPARTAPGYLVQFRDGSGKDDPVADVWPFDPLTADWWVDVITGCGMREAQYLIADAAFEPYVPQYLETLHSTAEVIRVTCLPLV
ncbi:hypothetical protein AB0E27_31440 [Streptomyces sparsogenes]|uniref:hypothetical protein n=1 Tax=Streptomyces sparsogenes TaxID=67365 RepID=UPI0033E08070